MSKDKLAQIFHFDLYGKREEKYQFLDNNSMGSIAWKELEPKEPDFYLVKKDFEDSDEYEKGFRVDELFPVYSSGIKTHDDGNLISTVKFSENNHLYYYRPFDIRYINYDLKKVQRHRFSVMKNMLKPNIALLFPKQAITGLFGFFISKGLTDINYTGTAGQFGAGLTFPLYLYHNPEPQQANDSVLQRIPNLNPEIVSRIAQKLSLHFSKEKGEDTSENASPVCYANSDEVSDDFKLELLPLAFAPIDILDYIYAVLYSPAYRKKYNEFLKIDFARVPYPKNQFIFWKFVKLGAELRQVHLLECTAINKFITKYPVDGNNRVGKVVYENERVYINHHASSSLSEIEGLQYFDNVPQIAWNFYIGGYQPAQRWLKDRKGRELTFDDIQHYQKIIVALRETDRIMKEIDKINMD